MGKASAIFGGGSVPIGAIVQGQFANDASYLPLDGNDYVSATYPSLDKTKMLTFGSNVFTSRTLPTSATWVGVRYGNGVFVAVSSTTAAATSSDGITWTARTTPSSGYVGLEFVNGYFIAFGSVGVLATSTDGITWTARTTSSVVTITSVAYGNGIYAFATDTETATASVYTSTDLATWTARSIAGGTTVASYNISFAFGKFYVAPYSFSGAAVTTFITQSTDGITWQQLTNYSGSVSASNALYSFGANYVNAVQKFRNKLILPNTAANTYFSDNEGFLWNYYYLANSWSPSTLNCMDSFGVAIMSTGGSSTLANISFDLKRWYVFTMPSSANWANTRWRSAFGNNTLVVLPATASSTLCATLAADTSKFRMPLYQASYMDVGDADRYYMKVA